jgi:hypothetical protein
MYGSTRYKNVVNVKKISNHQFSSKEDRMGSHFYKININCFRTQTLVMLPQQCGG